MCNGEYAHRGASGDGYGHHKSRGGPDTAAPGATAAVAGIGWMAGLGPSSTLAVRTVLR
jgi:hypothetical protein